MAINYIAYHPNRTKNMVESAADKKEREDLQQKESAGTLNSQEKQRLNELKQKANQ